MTRVAVVDIGTNSTRLLVAEVDEDGGLRELRRESIVTRLGEGVDATGRLGEAPQERVLAALDRYARAVAEADVRRAVMTSAVRDAANGPAFAGTVHDRYSLDARTLSGDEEARLTFVGATAARDDGPLLVIDIGGGSTELVVGARRDVTFHASVQVGVVRHSERHLRSDPPAGAELEALAADARAALRAGTGAPAGAALAVGGSATSLAAIDLGDRAGVEGHVLPLERLGALRDRLAALPLAERRAVAGLHPDRAPTIVAGAIILIEALAAHGLERVEVSERDILWGVALESTIAR